MHVNGGQGTFEPDGTYRDRAGDLPLAKGTVERSPALSGPRFLLVSTAVLAKTHQWGRPADPSTRLGAFPRSGGCRPPRLGRCVARSSPALVSAGRLRRRSRAPGTAPG